MSCLCFCDPVDDDDNNNNNFTDIFKSLSLPIINPKHRNTHTRRKKSFESNDSIFAQ